MSRPGEDTNAAAPDAVDRAVDKAREVGGDLPPERVAEARALVRRAAADPELMAGLDDLKRIPAALAERAVLGFLRALIEGGRLDAKSRAALAAQVDAINPSPVAAGMRVDFRDRVTGAPGAVMLAFDVCERDHDFGAELKLILPRVNAARHDEIRGQFSRILTAGFHHYSKVVNENRDLMIRILAGLSEAERRCIERPDRLYLDKEKSTLFLVESHPRRLGLFVRPI